MTNALIVAADRGFGRGMRGDGFHPFFALLCMALVAGVVGLIAWLIVRRRPVAPTATVTTAAHSPTFQAEAILAERLARGEITPDDYRSSLAALRDPGATA